MSEPLSDQVLKFPPTRYMGSKEIENTFLHKGCDKRVQVQFGE